MNDRTKPRGYTRQHGPISAFVLQHGPDDFSAVATPANETRATTQHIRTLEAAQGIADDAAQGIWKHDCATEGCGPWSVDVGVN